VLHRAADEAGALALAQRLARVLSVPYHLNGIQLEIGASVGGAMATRASESVEELLQHADLALYHVKSAGRGAACVF
uniref:diguanylate cyclase domain-containing protein n=1 Tax=Escherichia coli TaxID=562 RepID=UPI0013D3B36E